MTNAEIVYEYKYAVDKHQQITILSELTLRPKKEIIAILEQNGVDTSSSTRYKTQKRWTEDEINEVFRLRAIPTTQ